MPLFPIDTAHPALKTGYTSDDDGVSYLFAVFPADAALKAAEDGCEDIAEALTGWYRAYRGPGRTFAGDPVAKVFGKKVLVTQRVGRDI